MSNPTVPVLRCLLAVSCIMSALAAGPIVATADSFRVVAANLSSGTGQAYSLDNGAHSNIEGAGARILKGLKPDIVLIQELNVGDGSQSFLRQWVNKTLGPEYSVFRESGPGIPNGIISRFPLVEQGEWDDTRQGNRDFAWARIKLPNGKNLWAISVHFYSQKPAVRNLEAFELLQYVRGKIPAEDLVVLGGDFNTDHRGEQCVKTLSSYFHTTGPQPIDGLGDGDTNSSRRKPYDWVLADQDLQKFAVPVKIGGLEFAGGFVLDTRTFDALEAIAPAQRNDSGVEGMQHMAVVRDFSLN